MQDGGAVAVQRGFWIASGATGVAHAGSGVLIKARPLVIRRLISYPRLIAHQVCNTSIGRQFIDIAHGHPLADGFALGVHSLNDGKKSHVKAEHLVLCVIGNPCNLVRVQSGIDGVQDTATSAHTKIQL